MLGSDPKRVSLMQPQSMHWRARSFQGSSHCSTPHPERVTMIRGDGNKTQVGHNRWSVCFCLRLYLTVTVRVGEVSSHLCFPHSITGRRLLRLRSLHRCSLNSLLFIRGHSRLRRGCYQFGDAGGYQSENESLHKALYASI